MFTGRRVQVPEDDMIQEVGDPTFEAFMLDSNVWEKTLAAWGQTWRPPIALRSPSEADIASFSAQIAENDPEAGAALSGLGPMSGDMVVIAGSLDGARDDGFLVLRNDLDGVFEGGRWNVDFRSNFAFFHVRDECRGKGLEEGLVKAAVDQSRLQIDCLIDDMRTQKLKRKVSVLALAEIDRQEVKDAFDLYTSGLKEALSLMFPSRGRSRPDFHASDDFDPVAASAFRR